MIEINGEEISEYEAQELIRMIYNDAKQVAGVFHGMNRSEKFRVNWPDEDRFADANWKTFVEATRQMYAAKLGDPKTSKTDARKIHKALVLEAMISKGKETDNRLQLHPNSQQFDGDRKENLKILEQFGKRPNLRAFLMNTTTPFIQ